MSLVVAGNWKMHKTRAETRAFFVELGASVAKLPGRRILAVSPTLLETALQAAPDTGVEIYAQNCAWEPQGAFTGETSTLQLKDLGVKGTLIAHSERRQYFGETDASAAKRAARALAEGLEVIFCVGESLEERQSGRTFEVLARQLGALEGEVLKRLREGAPFFACAYEPVWAIGTGLTATTEQIRETHAWIGQWFESRSLPTPILYGGSVKPQNIKEITSLPKVDGGLVGGASLEAPSYRALCEAAL